jgi:hypothetical protein
MSEAQPIPVNLATRIAEFLDGEKTGQITLNVNHGRVESWEVREFVRAPSKHRPSETT